MNVYDRYNLVGAYQSMVLKIACPLLYYDLLCDDTVQYSKR